MYSGAIFDADFALFWKPVVCGFDNSKINLNGPARMVFEDVNSESQPFFLPHYDKNMFIFAGDSTFVFEHFEDHPDHCLFRREPASSSKSLLYIIRIVR